MIAHAAWLLSTSMFSSGPRLSMSALPRTDPSVAVRPPWAAPGALRDRSAEPRTCSSARRRSRSQTSARQLVAFGLPANGLPIRDPRSHSTGIILPIGARKPRQAPATADSCARCCRSLGTKIAHRICQRLRAGPRLRPTPAAGRHKPRLFRKLRIGRVVNCHEATIPATPVPDGRTPGASSQAATLQKVAEFCDGAPSQHQGSGWRSQRLCLGGQRSSFSGIRPLDFGTDHGPTEDATAWNRFPQRNKIIPKLGNDFPFQAAHRTQQGSPHLALP